MKVTIEFNLDREEEKKKYNLIDKIEDTVNAIHSINKILWNKYKLANTQNDQIKIKIYKEVYELFDSEINFRDLPASTENC